MITMKFKKQKFIKQKLRFNNKEIKKNFKSFYQKLTLLNIHLSNLFFLFVFKAFLKNV